MQLIEDAAQGPEVCGLGVWQFLNQFRGHVEGSSLYGRQHQTMGAQSSGKTGGNCGAEELEMEVHGRRQRLTQSHRV